MDGCSCSVKRSHPAWKKGWLKLILQKRPVRLEKWMTCRDASRQIKWHTTWKNGKFPWINHRSLVIMDDCKKCCEINTVSLTYGSFCVLLWNNDITMEKKDGCNCCHQITGSFQYIHAWNQGSITIINYDISLLQFLFCKNLVNLKACVAATEIAN